MWPPCSRRHQRPKLAWPRWSMRDRLAAWSVVTTYIMKSAFLQGQAIDCEVYIKPPKEASSGPDVIWKLKKCLYGLNGGTRMFYLSVGKKITELGCVVSTVDPSLFFYIDKCGRLAGILVSHVDDFLHAGEQWVQWADNDAFESTFPCGQVRRGTFFIRWFWRVSEWWRFYNQHGSLH